MQRQTLVLSNSIPIAQGKTRYIYEYPGDKSRLIKVHRKLEQPDGAGRFKRWYMNAEDRFIYLTGFVREISIFLQSRYGKPDPMVDFVAPILGFQDTDVGIGMIVSAVRDKEGSLAPTLRDLLKSNAMTPSRVAALRLLLKSISASDIVLGDLNFENIVLDETSDEGERFVLIDGLGERTFVPIQALSRYVRKKRKAGFIEKVENRLTKAGL